MYNNHYRNIVLNCWEMAYQFSWLMLFRYACILRRKLWKWKFSKVFWEGSFLVNAYWISLKAEIADP